jgi:PAS domain S-box-containing protein
MQINRHLNITEKLVLYFVFIGVLGIVVVGFYAFYSEKNALLNRTFDQLTSVKITKKKQIELFFNDRKRDIELLAGTSEMKEVCQRVEQYLKAENNIQAAKPINQIYLNTFSQIFNESSYFNSVVIANRNFDKIISVYDSTKKQFITRINKDFDISILLKKIEKKDGTIIQDYLISENGIPRLFIGTTIKSQDTILGFLVLEISSDAINNIMYEHNPHNGLGESGETYLVGDDGFMKSTSRFQDNSLMVIKVKTEGVERAFNNNPGVDIFDDYRGIKVLSSYSALEIKGLNWVILAEIDFKEAMLPILNIRNSILIIALIISIFIFGISYLISTKITLPIKNLKNASIEIGKGLFNKVLPINSDDEVGELTASFNTMAKQLNDQRDELLTREARLNHFYEATIDGIILQKDNQIFLVNQALIKLSGFSEQELLQMQANQIFDEIPIDNDILQQNITYESVLTTKDKNEIPVEVQINKISDNRGNINAIVIRDITKRKLAQEELKQERTKRLRSMIDGQEMERMRLSRELHDSLGQSLVVVKLKLEAIKINAPEQIQENIDELGLYFDTIVEEIRQISNNLMPMSLKEFGLITAINKLCNDIKKNTEIECEFTHNGDFAELPERISNYLFRIIQETTNNTLKHANAKSLIIRMQRDEDFLTLNISDDGAGFDKNKLRKDTNGLNNIKERISLLNGKFEFYTGMGEGTRYQITIPCNRN